jgi:hypothetical protein
LIVEAAAWILARMGPRGVGASRRTGARQLTAFVFILGGLFGSACSIEQPVSPVSLTGEWTTVTPPEPLRVEKNEQKLCLQLDAISDVDFQKGLVSVNGQRHALEGKAVDGEGIEYSLEVADRGGDTVCLYRAKEYPRGPDFPVDQTIVRLRLRSEPPLQVRNIRWHSYDPH